jgi:hypothetical protein
MSHRLSHVLSPILTKWLFFRESSKKFTLDIFLNLQKAGNSHSILLNVLPTGSRDPRYGSDKIFLTNDNFFLKQHNLLKTHAINF